MTDYVVPAVIILALAVWLLVPRRFVDRVGATLQRRSALIVRVMLAAAVLAVVVWSLLPGRYPYGAHMEYRISLELDGQAITMERVLSCTRSNNFGSDGNLIGFVDSRGPLYRCSPEWFALGLPDGSGLLIGAVGNPTDYGDGDRGYATGPCSYLPTVFWFDDQIAPDRAEFTFAETALNDPRSRVRALGCEVVSVSVWSRTASPFMALARGVDVAVNGSKNGRANAGPLLSALSAGSVSNARGLQFDAYYMTVTTEEMWRSVPDLALAVESLDSLTILTRENARDLFASYNNASIPALVRANVRGHLLPDERKIYENSRTLLPLASKWLSQVVGVEKDINGSAHAMNNHPRGVLYFKFVPSRQINRPITSLSYNDFVLHDYSIDVSPQTD